MMNIKFKGPSKRDLMKMVTVAAEKQISEKAQRAASPFGGVQIKFKYKSDGTLDIVEFEGSEKAVEAARNAVAT